jgi:hypothetical protein
MSTLLEIRVRGSKWLHEPVLAGLDEPEPEPAPQARAVADG